MSKPIVQLLLFLLLVMFATFVLLKYETFHEDTVVSLNNTMGLNLAQNKKFTPEDKNKYIVEEKYPNSKKDINLYRDLRKIKAYLANGEYNKGEDGLRNLLLFFPNNRAVLSLLGGVLYFCGNYDQARDMFRIIIKNNPDDPFTRERMGMVMQKQHKYTDAIDEFLHASLLNPESASMYLHLAGMYSIVGDKKKAIYNFAKAYEIVDVNIIPLSFDPTFDNIRDMPTFMNIINNAENILRVRDSTLFRKNKIKSSNNSNNSFFMNFRK